MAFLDYCVADLALQPFFSVLVAHSNNRDFDDLAFTIDDRNIKKNNCSVFV